MTRRVEYNGRVHEFPDDATDAEIRSVLEQSERAQPQQRQAAPVDPLATMTPAERAAIERGSRGRNDIVRRTVSPFSPLIDPIVRTFTVPQRREALMESARGAWRDIQQIPSLDFGRLAQDTADAAAEGVQNLPETGRQIINNLPQIGRAITYGPFVDEERAMQRLQLATMRGDEEGQRQAARDANAQTGGIALNAAGIGGGGFIRTPLQAAAFAGTLSAPYALSRNSDQPLQERLPHALTEIGGNAAFGGVLQGTFNAAGRALQTPPRTGQMVQRFDRAGVDPSLAAANEGGMSGLATNAVGGNLVAGPGVRARMRNQMRQGQEAAHRIANDYGQPRSLEGAGQLVESALQRFAREHNLPNPQPNAHPRDVRTGEWSFASKAEALYDEALRPIEGNPASLDNTLSVLDDLNRRADTRLVREFQADPTLRALERMVRRLARAGREVEPATLDDLATMASEIETARRSLRAPNEGLQTFVRRMGGIADDRGDIAGMDLRGRGASSVLNANGRTIDDAAIAAWENGYFPGENPPTAREFIDALNRNIRPPDTAGSANARQVLNYYEQQGINTGLRGDALRQALRPLVGVDEAAGAGGTLRDLRHLRTRIRMAQTQPRLGQTIDNAALQRLEAALTQDILDAAGDAAPNLRAADRFYRRGRERIGGLLQQFSGGNPGEAIPRILRLARERGDSRALAALRASMREDEWRVVVASVIEHMGQPAPGASGYTAQIGFSPSRFATAYRAISPNARRILFGSRGGVSGPRGSNMRMLADELDNLARVMQGLKSVEAGANFSNTATHLQTGGTAALAIANLPATLTLLATLGLLGEALTNPHFVRWLTSAPRGGRASAQGMRQHLAQLGRLAARDPALAPVYSELLAREREAAESQRAAPRSRPQGYGARGPAQLPQRVP